MMDFIKFAGMHGLRISNLVQGSWQRVSTDDKPNKRNGSYRFNGDVGFVINWAVHETAQIWRNENAVVDYKEIRKILENARKRKRQEQREAAKKAAGILKQARKGHHPYLQNKGFPNEHGWVWRDALIIPMRIEGSLVGCQLIDPNGNKRFLRGQQNKGACAVFDNKGQEILCEGYATAMSIRRSLKQQRRRYKIIVCFSAANLLEVAKLHPNAIVIADADEAGIKTASKTGLNYWRSGVDGEDYNDFELRVGIEKAGKLLTRWMDLNVG